MIPPTGALWKLDVYSLAYASTLPLVLPFMALHPRLRGGLWQRLSGRVGAAGERPVWMHGSSAGDVVALQPVAEELGEEGFALAISAWTRSGYQMATRRLGRRAQVFRAPLDLAGPVRVALERMRPRMLVLECLEMWPRLVHSCHRTSVPVLIINGRLSARSLRWFRRFGGLFEPCFAALSFVAAATQEDAERFAAAGTPKDRIAVEVSSKYSVQRRAPAPPACKIVLGSVHRREEELIAPWLRPLLDHRPDLRVVIAPRYPHRARRVCRRLARIGIRASLWSRRERAAPARVQIVDRMGVLASQYEGARVAFVGGSLTPHGGHNPLEPAACGAPVLVGPFTDNCRAAAAQLLDAGAAVSIHDGQTFFDAAVRLLDCDQDYARSREAGLGVVSSMAGSSRRIAERILSHLR